jgi:hypothetical protein
MFRFGALENLDDGRNTKLDATKDWRVRISLPPSSNFAFRSGVFPSIVYPLISQSGKSTGTDGVVFPHTPTVTMQHNARYQEQALTHSNYKNYFYEGSDVAPITITGLFTCQNGAEALYLMASLQFLRACTKMYFGKGDPKAGTPPTLVRLSGYGDHYLPSITGVVTQVSHTMPDDCDYIKYSYKDNEEYGWMPTSSTLTVTIQPVLSRQRQAEEMKLDDYVRGLLVKDSSNRGGII